MGPPKKAPISCAGPWEAASGRRRRHQQGGSGDKVVGFKGLDNPKPSCRVRVSGLWISSALALRV